MNGFFPNFIQSPHGEQFISVILEERWGNHELPPESALALIPIHWRCLKTVQGRMYQHSKQMDKLTPNQHLTQLIQLQFTVIKQRVGDVEVTKNPTAVEIVIFLLKVHPLYRHEFH